MNYSGRHLKFDNSKYVFKEVLLSNAIEIYVYEKETDISVGTIICFFYKQKHGRPDYGSSAINAMHIKILGVEQGYTKKGIATHLMKRVIEKAEELGLDFISVNPSALTDVISQEELELFYKKFTFCSSKKKMRTIDFMIVID